MGLGDMPSILGFRCTISDVRVRNAIEYVLTRIRERQRDDFKRLRRKVRGFHWLPKEEAQNGTLGHWKRVPITKAFQLETEREAKALLRQEYPCRLHPPPKHVRHLADALRQEEHRRPGKVHLCRELTDAPEFRLLSTIAHELGHAATTQEDFEKRDSALGGDSEWASESCADYYAYRWGFGRQVRRCQRTRRVGHHGGLPGDVIQIAGPTGKSLKYRVTRNFYYRRVEPGEID